MFWPKQVYFGRNEVFWLTQLEGNLTYTVSAETDTFRSGRPSNVSVSVIGYIGHFWLFRHCIGQPKSRNLGISADTTEILAFWQAISVLKQPKWPI